MKLVLKVLLHYYSFVSTSNFAQSYPIDKGSKLIAGAFSITSAGEIYTQFGRRKGNYKFLNGSFGYFVTKGVNIGGKILFS
jgi:hypothetical protein